MKLSEKELRLRKRLYLTLLLSGLVLFALYSLVFIPVHSIVVNDIAFDGTPLPEIIDFGGRMVEIIGISVCCALVSYGIFRLGGKNFALGGLIYSALVLYKYALSILWAWLDSGSIPLEWAFDMGYIVLMTLAEIAPFAIVWFVICSVMKSYRERERILRGAGRDEGVLPFKALFHKENPLQVSALVCSLTVLVTRLGGKVINDVQTIVEITSLPIMILDYLSYCIFAVLCYAVMLLAFSLVGNKLDK